VRHVPVRQAAVTDAGARLAQVYRAESARDRAKQARGTEPSKRAAKQARGAEPRARGAEGARRRGYWSYLVSR
jgi:hypothetical protein